MEIVKPILSFLLLINRITSVVPKTGPAHDKVVVCYLSTWAVYRPNRGSYSIDNFDPNLCTNVIYAFSGLDITKDAIKSLDPWQDLKDDYGKAGFERLTTFKKNYPHLKVTLAIGGWNEGSTNYSKMASDPMRRKRFVKNALHFIRLHNFDGLDLDWEYPALRGGAPIDKQNFVHLVKELNEEFKPHQLLLTSAIGAGKNTIEQAYNIFEISKYLDYMHIMCYDYGGSWDKKITPNAPLTNEGILNIKYTIDYLISLGAPRNKIVLGIPFYGRSFITNNQGYYGDVSNDIGFEGPFTKENGFLGYNEICLVLSNKTSGWQRTWDAQTAQSIARQNNQIAGETKVVVYDSSRSIANKMRYAMQQSLAGAMIWSIDTDDFYGDCDTDGDTYSDFNTYSHNDLSLTIPRRSHLNYPLLRTINEGIILALEEIENEIRQKEEDKENEIPHGYDEHGDKGGCLKLYPNIVIFVILMNLIYCNLGLFYL